MPSAATSRPEVRRLLRRLRPDARRRGAEGDGHPRARSWAGSAASREGRELRLAKDYLIGSFPLRLDTSAKVADFIVAIEEQGLGLDYADRYKAAIARVTAADVQRVAARYFPPDTFSRVVVGTAK